MAERVRITGKESNDGVDAQVSTQGNLCITYGPIGLNKTYEGAVTSGATNIATHDFFGDMSRPATRGYFLCDGDGNIALDVSEDGVSYGSKATVKKGEKVDLNGYSIKKLRVTIIEGQNTSAYRANLL